MKNATGVEYYVNEYLSRVNRNAQFYFVTLLPYETKQTPTLPNVHYIFGWSNAVLKFVMSEHNNNLASYIRNVYALETRAKPSNMPHNRKTTG